jgi:hypothetical protein
LDFQYSLTGTAKKLIFHDPQMDGVVIANFAVVATTPVVGFTQTGWWYEYFTGDSVNVNNVNMTLTLQPSDYRVYTTQRIQKPVIIETASLDEMNQSIDLRVYPIPALEELFVSFYNVDATNITLELYDQMGRIVGSTELLAEPSSDVETILPLADLARGTYVLSVKSGNSIAKTTIVKE